MDQQNPVHKKLKIGSFEFQFMQMEEPETYTREKMKDIALTISCMTNKNTTMWSSWNSPVTVDHLSQQRIEYMRNIALSSQRAAVVQNTIQ